MYDTLDIAQYILSIKNDYKINDMSNTKMQKLLYIIYGVYMSLYKEKIFKEQPKYFPYGPLFPRVYNKYDILKSQTINDIDIDIRVKNVIRFVLKSFGKLSANELTIWSHLKDSPWDKMNQKDTKFGNPLDDGEIRDYFSNYLNRVEGISQ
jgi:uncharacterized phage-associated protein